MEIFAYHKDRHYFDEMADKQAPKNSTPPSWFLRETEVQTSNNCALVY